MLLYPAHDCNATGQLTVMGKDPKEKNHHKGNQAGWSGGTRLLHGWGSMAVCSRAGLRCSASDGADVDAGASS